jgi:hypothetical protein
MDALRDEEAAPLLAAAGSGGRRSHAADAHVLSAAFLFVFSAYGAAQNLQSSVNAVPFPFAFSPPCSPILPRPAQLCRFHIYPRTQEGDLGTVSLGILYTSFTLFSVVARMGPSRALVVGTTGYLLFILANLVPAWCVQCLLSGNKTRNGVPWRVLLWNRTGPSLVVTSLPSYTFLSNI